MTRLLQRLSLSSTIACSIGFMCGPTAHAQQKEVVGLPANVSAIVTNSAVPMADREKAIRTATTDEVVRSKAVEALKYQVESEKYQKEMDALDGQIRSTATEYNKASQERVAISQRILALESDRAVVAGSERAKVVGDQIAEQKRVLETIDTRLDRLTNDFNAKAKTYKESRLARNTQRNKLNSASALIETQVADLRADLKTASVLASLNNEKNKSLSAAIKIQELQSAYDNTRLANYMQAKLERLMGSEQVCATVSQCKGPGSKPSTPDLSALFKKPESSVPPAIPPTPQRGVASEHGNNPAPLGDPNVRRHR